MEIAKNTDLPDLLEHLGYHLKRSGRYYTTQEMDSLMIKNRRTWRRYSNDTGGDAITFLQTFEGKGFREAVEYLLDFNGRAIVEAKSASWEMPYGHSPLRSLASPLPTKPEGRLCGGPIDSPRDSRPRPPPEEEKRPEFALPPANEDSRVFACVVAKSAQLRFRLRRKLRSLPCSSFSHRTRFAGLRWEPYGKRGIAPQVIRAFLNAGLVYEDEKYHNCVFVGWDNNGEARFASKRGTTSSQSPLSSVSAFGENCARSLAPPFPVGPASLGSDGSPFRDGVSFKRDVLGSDKSIAFPIPCDPAVPWVLVFEAPIDASGRNPFHSVSALRRKLRSIPLPLLSPQSLKNGFAGAPLGCSPALRKNGAPAATQRSGCGGERRRSEMSEPCRLRRARDMELAATRTSIFSSAARPKKGGGSI